MLFSWTIVHLRTKIMQRKRGMLLDTLLKVRLKKKSVRCTGKEEHKIARSRIYLFALAHFLVDQREYSWTINRCDARFRT